MQPSDALVSALHEWTGILRRLIMGNFSSYARDNGLTMAQFGAMLHIYHKGACGVSDIGSDLGVTNSAASQMLDRLVQLGLITRLEDPADRRGKQIDLTEKGRQILSKSSHSYVNWMENLAKSLTSEQQEQVRHSLAILIDKSRQLGPVQKQS